MPIRIASTIPLPKKDSRGVKSPLTTALAAMKVGDSIPINGKNFKKIVLTRSNVSNWARRHGGRFTIRAVAGGYRCWRVE